MDRPPFLSMCALGNPESQRGVMDYLEQGLNAF